MLAFTYLFSLIPLEFLARAGGGGSGGSGSSGGGDGIFIILGYLPMHFVGAALIRSTRKHDNLALKAGVNVVGWVIAVIYAIIWANIWGFLGTIVGLAALIGMAAGLYGWFSKIKQSPMVQSLLKNAAANDSAWDEEKLTEYVQTTFTKYQQDWSKLDVKSMQPYLTEYYLGHVQLLMACLAQLGRKNIISDINIAEVVFTNVDDSEDDSKDNFTVGISASARDDLIEALDNSVLFTDNSAFTEYWQFQRDGKDWRLAFIAQDTASNITYNQSLHEFAVQAGYYYSQDMGWLFIPKRGQLFDGAAFGTSDINNHIVGLYGGKMLVQLFSYLKNQSSTKSYVIAEAALPKSYGEIVVRRKRGISLFGGIKGLEKIETEWPDFNKKYEVYASDYEQATSFELLNPTYMEQLEALPFEVNIEVVDNVVYLYTVEAQSDVDTYRGLLDLLQKAFKEMRL
ncbi:MAG: DUF3137 domain-containing protein [Candidatus Saccharimonas sp.]